MSRRAWGRWLMVLAGLLAIPALGTGCLTPQLRGDDSGGDIPRELDKVTLPPYVIEPPDILLIEAVKIIRFPDDPLGPLDVLFIRARGLEPISEDDDEVMKEFKRVNGPYRVENDGTVKLGPIYGSVPVAGLALEQARQAIEGHLKQRIVTAQVEVSMPELQGKQPISGEHLVRPDGTVSLGVYGSVPVAGLTLEQAKAAIESYLARHLLSPEVTVDVLAYNSKVYYVITDGGGYGEQVVRLPLTGNETVLDAVSQINGLPAVASKKDIWVARPGPADLGYCQVLPVDWEAITEGGATATNYQLLPGDRVYVMADRWITVDSFIAKITAPFERLFGFTLLGHSTVRALQFGHRGTQGGVGGGF